MQFPILSSVFTPQQLADILEDLKQQKIKQNTDSVYTAWVGQCFNLQLIIMLSPRRVGIVNATQ